MFFSLVRRATDSVRVDFSGAGAAQLVHLQQGLGQREVRRHHAQRDVVARDFDLLIHGRGKAFQPRQIGLGIGFGLDGMLGVQERRQLAIIAGQLAEDIGLARAAGTIGKARVGLGIGLQPIQDHVITDRILGAQRGAVESCEPGKLAGGDGFVLGDSGQGCIVDLAFLIGARAGIQPQPVTVVGELSRFSFMKRSNSAFSAAPLFSGAAMSRPSRTGTVSRAAVEASRVRRSSICPKD